MANIHSANQEEFTFFLNYDTSFERVFLDQYGALLNSEQSQFIQLFTKILLFLPRMTKHIINNVSWFFRYISLSKRCITYLFLRFFSFSYSWRIVCICTYFPISLLSITVIWIIIKLNKKQLSIKSILLLNRCINKCLLKRIRNSRYKYNIHFRVKQLTHI